MFIKEYIHICSCLMVSTLLFLFCTIQHVAAVENPSEPEGTPGINTPIAGIEEKADKWEYVFENRPDPFLPFIQPAVATKNIAEEEDVELTGMQLFEPGQLILVAIMFSPSKKIAMVEDVTGKGYILNEGMLIGRYGVVSQINMNDVNITEMRRVAGKEVVTPVVMRLKKEGDQ